jgi:hypothetical protein
MFQPKYPTPDTYTITTAVASAPSSTRAAEPVSPALAAPAPAARPALQITPATVATGGAAVLVVGAVLVSMLLAVAVTAGSLALLAVVLRSLRDGGGRHRH